MKYEEYKIEDFLDDEEFVKWVAAPNEQNSVHWRKVISDLPHKELDINTAVDILKALNEHVDGKELEEDAKHIWQHLSPLLQENPEKVVGNRNKEKFIIRKQWIGIAASIVIMIGLGWWTNRIINQPDGTLEVAALISKSNPKGRKSIVKLKDGSEVILNAESTIQYAENFGTNERNLILDGEAFFKVAKNPDLPFVVKTGNIITTAIGTSFNISNFEEDESILISLATGKIEVKEIPGIIGILAGSNFLEPGDHVSYSRDSKEFKQWHDEYSISFLWKDGIIQFNRASLEEIIKYLERWYDVKITVEGQKATGLIYTGTFDNQSLEKVLDGLSFSLHFEYSINQDQINIVFK